MQIFWTILAAFMLDLASSVHPIFFIWQVSWIATLTYVRKQTTRFNRVRYTLLFLQIVFWDELQISTVVLKTLRSRFDSRLHEHIHSLYFNSLYSVHTHSTHCTIGLCSNSICQNVAKHLMENQLIYCIIKM